MRTYFSEMELNLSSAHEQIVSFESYIEDPCRTESCKKFDTIELEDDEITDLLMWKSHKTNECGLQRNYDWEKIRMKSNRKETSMKVLKFCGISLVVAGAMAVIVIETL